MLHAFNDFPHSHFTKPMLFQDYYVWFRRTLEIAARVTSVNWVFKEHPAAAFYVTRDLDMDALFGGMPDEHIRFLNRDADFSAASVAMTDQRFWAAAATHLRDNEPSALEHQVDSLAEFMRNESYTQYIDLEKFGFMRPVIYGTGDPPHREPEHRSS